MSTLTDAEPRSTTPRRKARAGALQVLYEVDEAGHEPAAAFATMANEDLVPGPAQSFARELVRGVLANLKEIDSQISTYAPSWPVDQISVVDRNLLRIAVYEILIDVQTPTKVAINEAVELSKVFGADGSPGFVNGVLGSLVRSTAPGDLT